MVGKGEGVTGMGVGVDVGVGAVQLHLGPHVAQEKEVSLQLVKAAQQVKPLFTSEYPILKQLFSPGH
ncbi:hypothetical protein A3C98_03935 [Candidatus Roizmanbacteria bacterium RIFCSPHIGHO2_02_FULL_37_15]|nr:MAG: hypothetical protein A3C98_03935 [Candidatus Roizmanbacteria bacterium RIFCSPHIGHO2_02_FULL_37_15]